MITVSIFDQSPGDYRGLSIAPDAAFPDGFTASSGIITDDLNTLCREVWKQAYTAGQKFQAEWAQFCRETNAEIDSRKRPNS
jgi:hypothetical protein